MAYAGSTGPKPNRISTNRPDVFLLMGSNITNSSSEASVAGAQYLGHWRDLICLFEYNFEDGDKVNARAVIYSSMATVSGDDPQNRVKLIWSLGYQLHSDPRRAFSSGITVDGTRLHVRSGCRVALSNFPSIE